MSWCKTLLLPILVAGVLVLAGAMGQQPRGNQPQPSAPPPPAPAPKVDAEGAKILAEAISQLDPKKVGSVETAFWQQADLQGFTFQAEGSYLSAPDERLHLNLKITLGESRGTLEVVSDGSTLWEVRQIGQGEREITQLELRKVLDSLKGQSEGEQARIDFLRSQSFTGLTPLLQSIQQRMIVTSHEKVVKDGRGMTKLNAVWSPELARGIVPPNGQWPMYLARQCVVYLEILGQKVNWPSRVEWWGPTPGRPMDGQLLVMEFRSPKLNQPLTEAKAAREFRFNPGHDKDKIRDNTAGALEMVKFRAQQLAAQKNPGAPPVRR